TATIEAKPISDPGLDSPTDRLSEPPGEPSCTTKDCESENVSVSLEQSRSLVEAAIVEHSSDPVSGAELSDSWGHDSLWAAEQSATTAQELASEPVAVQTLWGTDPTSIESAAEELQAASENLLFAPSPPDEAPRPKPSAPVSFIEQYRQLLEEEG